MIVFKNHAGLSGSICCEKKTESDGYDNGEITTCGGLRSGEQIQKKKLVSFTPSAHHPPKIRKILIKEADKKSSFSIL